MLSGNPILPDYRDVLESSAVEGNSASPYNAHDFVAMRTGNPVMPFLSGMTASPELTKLTDHFAEQHSGEFDAILDNAYRNYIGWRNRPELNQEPPLSGPITKRIIANDFHCPFQHEDALHQLLDEAPDTHELFINGDLADMWSMSRWAKLRRISSPLHDFQQTQKTLNLLAKHFRKIIIMEGNHDTRQWKFMADLLPPEVLEYLEVTAPAALHPLHKMLEELPNVELVKPVRTGYAEYAFLHQIGDAVFTHAEVFSIIPNRAVGNVINWLFSYALPKKLVQPFRIVIQAHTHQAGKTYNNGGIVGIENGCMTHTPEYQGSAKIMSPRPSTVGYTRLYQDQNGVTDLNRTNFVAFEEEHEAIFDPKY
jgi:hypothetical protein